MKKRTTTTSNSRWERDVLDERGAQSRASTARAGSITECESTRIDGVDKTAHCRCGVPVDTVSAKVFRDFGVPVECSKCRRQASGPWPILYWGSTWRRRGAEHATAKLVEGLFALFAGTLPAEIMPVHCVRGDVPRDRREKLARVLATGEGVTEVTRAKARDAATCLMCGEPLGDRDVCGYGFQWPEGSEHYVLEHDVWTPGCDRLLEAARLN